jgi:integrase
VAAFGRGEKHVGRELTVAAWLDEWLLLQRHLKPGSRRAYADRIELYLKPAFRGKRLWELEGDHVTRAMERLATTRGARTPEGLSAGTVDAAFRTLSAALEAAYRRGKAPRNACRSANVPRPRVQVEPPTFAELDRLFECLAGHPYRLVYEVMRWTGARHGEVLGLRWADMRGLESGVLTFTKQATGSLKSGRPRPALVPPALAAELRRIPRHLGSELVFHTATGRPLDKRNVLRAFDRALLAAGILPPEGADLAKYRPHDLRHAYATMLLEAGVPHAFTAAALGHASIGMLDRYSHVRILHDGEARRRMAEAWGEANLYLFMLPAAPATRAARG